MNVRKHIREVAGSPYYLRNPTEVISYTYAKWIFARTKVTSPLDFLLGIGIDTDRALADFEKWRPRLTRVVSDVRNERGSQGGISIEDGTVLYGLVRALGPRHVVETGVAAGVSSSFIAAALIENGAGELHSIELPPEKVAAQQLQDGCCYEWDRGGVGWAIPMEIRESMKGRHHLTLADVRAALPPLLERIGPIDIFFHDDLHTPSHMFWEYELVWPHLRPGGILVSDDADFGWIRFCRKHHLGRDALLNMQRLTAVTRR